MTHRTLAWSAAAVLIAALSRAGAQAPASFTIEPVALPAPIDSGEPRLTVQGDRVLLSWIESAKNSDVLKFAERLPAGWSTPQTIVFGPDLMVNAADVPSVHLLSNNTLVAQWLRKNGPDPESYNLQITRSSDNGRTWSSPIKPYRDVTAVQHGFASVFDTGGGGFGLIWLDGRSGADMALRATVFAPDGKPGEDTEIDGRVCECCQTSVALSADGPIAVFRDRSADDVRDIAVTRLASGRWSVPTVLHKDGWKINGCPVNGPSIAAAGRDAVVAWFSAPAAPGHVFVAFSADAGRTFGAPIRVDDASAIGRVEVGLLGDGSAVVSWIDFTSGRSQFKVRRIDRRGTKGPAAMITEGLGTQYPRMAVRRDELVFAWGENTRGTTQVRTARAVVPAALRKR